MGKNSVAPSSSLIWKFRSRWSCYEKLVVSLCTLWHDGDLRNGDFALPRDQMQPTGLVWFLPAPVFPQGTTILFTGPGGVLAVHQSHCTKLRSPKILRQLPHGVHRGTARQTTCDFWRATAFRQHLRTYCCCWPSFCIFLLASETHAFLGDIAVASLINQYRFSRSLYTIVVALFAPIHPIVRVRACTRSSSLGLC